MAPRLRRQAPLWGLGYIWGGGIVRSAAPHSYPTPTTTMDYYERECWTGSMPVRRPIMSMFSFGTSASYCHRDLYPLPSSLVHPGSRRDTRRRTDKGAGGERLPDPGPLPPSPPPARGYV